MKFKNVKLLYLSFIFFIASIIFSGCGMKELNSNWRDHEITIDGIDNGLEWEGTRYFFGEEKVTIGLFNDNKNFYIRLSSRDQRLKEQMLRAGLTIWFNSEGGKEKTVGIHFPIGMLSGGTEKMRVRERAPVKEDPDRFNKMLEEAQKEIEIFGPGNNESSTMLTADARELGINGKIDISKGNLVYELKIPLDRNKSQPYGIGTIATETISIGFETGKIEMEQLKSDHRGQSGGMGGDRADRPGGMGGMGGDRAGRPGGMGGTGGRGMGAGMRQIPESLELWLKTRLASEPGS